jgi:ferric-dicitrate binding protein FerR (iron transport regulator)
MASGGRRGHAQAALDRAIEREREAIKLHESAADQLERIATRLENQALHNSEDLIQQHALDAATNARRRAESARERAEGVRMRLREEGVDPEG